MILVAFASATFAQDAADTPPEQGAVIANDRAYEAAYASGDAKALVDFFADDAEYTAEDGRTFKGRARNRGNHSCCATGRLGGAAWNSLE